MKIKLSCILILLFLSASTSVLSEEKNQSKTFFGKVLKVDGHNVMHVAKDNGIQFVSLAYVLTPVRGEPYFEETNSYLKEAAENKYLMFTISSYGRNANVKPVLVRLKDQKSLNAAVIQNGMAMVDLATKPPPALIDQAITASDSKVGMWALENKLDPLNREMLVSHRKKIKSFLSAENTSGIKPYILVEQQKLALPIACAFHVEYKNIALTAHAARHKGYTVMENCDAVLPTKQNSSD